MNAATLEAARGILAAQLRASRRSEWERTGRTPRYPYFAERRKAKDDAWLDGFMHATEGGPQDEVPWATEDAERPVTGLAGFWVDGWEAGVEWARRNAVEPFTRLMRHYALEQVPISRSDGGPFYAAGQVWRWEDTEDGGHRQVWVGPEHLPKDPGEAALLLAVTGLQYATIRWAIRIAEGRADEELRRDVEREIGSVKADDLPIRNPYWEPDPKLKNPLYGKWLAYHAWGPNAHKITEVPQGAGVKVYCPTMMWDDKRSKVAYLRGPALVGAARKVFSIGVPEGAFEESTGQGVML